MRARSLWFIAVIAAGSAAHAEPAETREDQMLVTFTPLHSSDIGFRWRADVLAAALATSERGAATQLGSAGTVSVDAGVTAAKDCDLVAGGGQLAARSDQPALAAQQWASVCLLGGDGHIRLDHRLQWDVMPRLLAAPRLRPGTQRREMVALDINGSTRPLDDTGPRSLVQPREFLQGGTLRLETEVGWTERGDGHDVRLLFDIVMRNYRREYPSGPPLQIAIFAPRMEVATGVGLGAPVSAGLMADAARVEGFRLGGLRFGARLGGRVGGIAAGEGTSARQNMVTVGEGGISVEHDLADGVTMRLGGDRQSWAAWNASVVVDDRATWSLLATHGRFHARLDVAAARTHLVSIDQRTDFTTGGATLSAGLELSPQFALEAHSEAGKSIYARDAMFDAPRWASETLVMLATHVGS